MTGEGLAGAPPWKQGEDAALALRHRLRYEDRPVNVWDAIRHVGVALALEDFGQDGGDGRYLYKDGRALIVVNVAKRVTRQRFTAAHELGHHEMHRHDRESIVVRDDDIFKQTDDPLEMAANAFAATFLAPAAGLAQALGPDKRGKHISPEDVVSLMADFGLSYEATVYRLNNAGLVNQPQRRTLIEAAKGSIGRMLAAAGIDEAKLFPPKYPLPPDYVAHVVEMWRHHHISDVRFAEMLRLSPAKAERYREQNAISRPELPDYDRDAAKRLRQELT